MNEITMVASIYGFAIGDRIRITGDNKRYIINSILTNGFTTNVLKRPSRGYAKYIRRLKQNAKLKS